EVLECLPLSTGWAVAEDFGRIVSAKFEKETTYYHLNSFGILLAKFFDAISKHFSNNIYACAVKKKNVSCKA
ncbi:MAG: hypothetical protein AB1633_12325, partial [Elusimicrobiota bacterium]